MAGSSVREEARAREGCRQRMYLPRTLVQFLELNFKLKVKYQC
jgi:hypothetical protein